MSVQRPFPDTSALEAAGFTCLAAPESAQLHAEAVEEWSKGLAGGGGIIAKVSVARGQAKLVLLKPDVHRGFRISWYCVEPVVSKVLIDLHRIEDDIKKERNVLNAFPQLVLADDLDDPLAGRFAL